MTSNDLFKLICDKALKYGLHSKNAYKDAGLEANPRPNAVTRRFLQAKEGEEKAFYFGFIKPTEPESGGYADFSLVVFPNENENVKSCLIALGVGSMGFNNDYELASLPWLPREFTKLNNLPSKNYRFFSKIDYSDTHTVIPGLAESVANTFPAAMKTYGNVIQAVGVIDLSDDNHHAAMEAMFTWLAVYAEICGWGGVTEKNARSTILRKVEPKMPNAKAEIRQLLRSQRFVVLQGAPGVGKTYTALEIAKEDYERGNMFFQQFHAETTYADFVWGLRPAFQSDDTDSQFVPEPGILLKAIKRAREVGPQKRVLLIIDEINRANLSNVLGPVFYLFEKHRDADLANFEIEIGNEKLGSLPENLDVIATMNTADRSLAVVDFALRRRFMWYTIKPKALMDTLDLTFLRADFDAMGDIFRKYATDAELNLQPGPSYFQITSGEKERESAQREFRLRYELLPLIKEYLQEGFMPKARDAFNLYFLERIRQPIFE